MRAGLFKWDDVLKANDGSVVLPDGSRPTMIIDQNRLSTLRNTLQKRVAAGCNFVNFNTPFI